MVVLNWISDHWLLVIVLATITSATITVPKICAAFFAMLAADRIGR